MPPAVEAQSPNLWTAREFLHGWLLKEGNQDLNLHCLTFVKKGEGQLSEGGKFPREAARKCWGLKDKETKTPHFPWTSV